MEIRDGFVVTDERKHLWVLELEMIDLVEAICVKYSLNYFFIWGAALGVVRHKGFIPWDDDIDIGMLRPDYDRFVQIFENENRDRYVMQYGYEGCNAETGTFLRIRSKESTSLIKAQLNKTNCTHGTFIEVYPFDNVYPGKKRDIQRKESMALKRILDERLDNNKITDKRLIPFKLFFSLIPTPMVWRLWEHVCKRYNDTTTEYVEAVALPQYMKESILKFRRTDVEKTIYRPFGDRMVRIPINYDACLTASFGDYMKMPPTEERGKRHSTIVFYDTANPPEYYAGSDIPRRFFEGEYDLSKL